MRVVILAAGKGTRMKSDLPKVLVKIRDKPIIEYLVQSVISSGVDKNPIIVVSPDNKELISQALKKYNCQYAIQKEQLGTAHAMACAKVLIDKDEDYIVNFYGDHPFIKAASIKKLSQYAKGIITLMTIKVKDFKDWRQCFYHWGRIIRNDSVQEIIEFIDADEKVKKITELSPSFFCFKNNWLWENISKIKNDNVKGEYYLTDLVKIAYNQGHKINSILIDPKEAIGINSQEELAKTEVLLK